MMNPMMVLCRLNRIRQRSYQGARQRMRLAAIALLLVSALPTISRADEPAIPDHDARLDGYTGSVVMDAGGTATSYIMLFLLGGLCVGVVFISGERTHLD